MLFKLSNLNSNLALTLGYLNPALDNSALSDGATASRKDKLKLSSAIFRTCEIRCCSFLDGAF